MVDQITIKSIKFTKIKPNTERMHKFYRWCVIKCFDASMDIYVRAIECAFIRFNGWRFAGISSLEIVNSEGINTQLWTTNKRLRSLVHSNKLGPNLTNNEMFIKCTLHSHFYYILCFIFQCSLYHAIALFKLIFFFIIIYDESWELFSLKSITFKFG